MDAERYRWVRSHFDQAAALLAYHLDDPDGLDDAIDERIKKGGRLALAETTSRIVGAASQHPDWDMGANVDMLGSYKEQTLKEVEEQ